MASGLASLRDAVALGMVIRWCRRFAPQPPANGWEPSGFREAGREDQSRGDLSPGLAELRYSRQNMKYLVRGG